MINEFTFRVLESIWHKAIELYLAYGLVSHELEVETHPDWFEQVPHILLYVVQLASFLVSLSVTPEHLDVHVRVLCLVPYPQDGFEQADQALQLEYPGGP